MEFNMDAKKVLIDDIVKRLTKADDNKMYTQHQYEMILSEAAELRMSKVLQYGEERYDEPDVDVQLWMTFCDVWRKFSRLRQLIRIIIDENRADNYRLECAEKLRDDYLDMLNYGAMGVQIIDKLDLINKLKKSNDN
jgi:SpoVK/Ycf46/Vps4 family AAA+-type ATPase